MSNMKMFSPATPHKSPSRSVNDYDDASSIENGASIIKGSHQASLHEPSPASTYGDTEVDGSGPATPQEDGSLARRSSKPLGLKSFASSGKPSHGSPSTGLLSSPHPIHDLRRPTAPKGQPGRPRTLSDIRNDPTVGSLAQSAGTGASPPKVPKGQRYYRARRGTNNTSSSSPGGRRQAFNSPSGHAPGTPSKFVVHDKASGVDDPFMSPKKGTPCRNAEKSPSWCQSQDTPSAEHQSSSTAPTTEFASLPNVSVQGGDIGDAEEPISAENAQAKFLPSACVFVANLLQTSTDEELERSVSTVFAEFGKCWVKIRRDNRQMPFAFVQYEKDDNARRAITEGRGRVIDGRRVRTERARVNRVLYISNLNGRPVSTMQAREIMEPFGELESITYPTETEMALYRLPRGCFVKYVYFQDAKDAQLFLRNDPNFQVEVPPIPQTAAGPMPRMETDPFAIHISGLNPETTTEDELIRYFGKHGRVVSASVHVKASRGGPGWVCYAFVRFARQEEAARAIDTEHNNFWHGRKIQVRVRELVDPVARAALRLMHLRGVQASGDSSSTLPVHFRRMVHEQTDDLVRLQGPSITTSLNGDMAAMSMASDGVRAVFPQQYMVPYGAMVEPHPYWNFGNQCPMGLHGPSQKYPGSHAPEDDPVPGISAGMIAQGSYPHPGWYPHYNHEQAQSPVPAPSGSGGQHTHSVPYQIFPQTMGHFAYPPAGIPYGQYHMGTYAYQTPQGAQVAHGIQQPASGYPQVCEERRAGNNSSVNAGRFEEQVPAPQ